ncbi:MAG: bifunctional methylenetetrahydrofolate dehydrogenase/methenyltetrahydrofolate cyclohydrolase FolD [Gammaproteobacteria bacterium]
MTAKSMDGKRAAGQLLAQCRQQSETFLAEHGRRPGLAVMIAGDNPASEVYVANKIRACENAGLHSQMARFAADAATAQLLAGVRGFNDDDAIDGILVQLPLPPDADAESVLDAVSPHKDVDGFHAVNIGRLVLGLPALAPCTPSGCMRLLSDAGVNPSGKNAVILGRSNIVGKPMALMLVNAGATVTVCNSKTPDIAAETRRADIVVAAIGKPRFVRGDMIKPGAVLIDVGINRDSESKKIVGDVDFDECAQVAGHITPVPGGVGPMTVAMLIANTIAAAQSRQSR